METTTNTTTKAPVEQRLGGIELVEKLKEERLVKLRKPKK